MNEVRKERRWINEHRDDPKVRTWLKGNEPPPEWEGTPMQYAYTEMPQWDVRTGVLIGVGLLGIVGFSMWLLNRKKAQAPLIAPTQQGQGLVRVPRCREGEVLIGGQCQSRPARNTTPYPPGGYTGVHPATGIVNR